MIKDIFIFLSFVVAAITASYGSPIKSIIGAKGISEIQEDGAFKNPYIADGLVAMWDIESGLEGGTWTDLIGGRTIDVSSCQIGHKELYIPRNVVIGGYCNELTSLCTVELVMRITGRKQNCYRFSSDTIAFHQIDWSPNNSRVRFGSFYSGQYTREYLDNTKRDFTYPFSVSIGSVNIMFYNGLSYTGSYVNFLLNNNTGNFVFDASSEMSNTGLYISSFRIYNRELTEDEVQYNYSIDKARFDLP